MTKETIADRHEVPDEDKEKQFAELVYFLHSRIDECEFVSKEKLFEWIEEHQNYARSRKCELSYTSYSA